MAEQKFPDLIARPIAAQFMDRDAIALFEFQESNNPDHHRPASPTNSLAPPEELDPRPN